MLAGPVGPPLGLGLNEGLGSTVHAKAAEGGFATVFSLQPPECAADGDAPAVRPLPPMRKWSEARSPALAAGLVN